MILVFLGMPHRDTATQKLYRSCHPFSTNWKAGEKRTATTEAEQQEAQRLLDTYAPEVVKAQHPDRGGRFGFQRLDTPKPAPAPEGGKDQED